MILHGYKPASGSWSEWPAFFGPCYCVAAIALVVPVFKIWVGDERYMYPFMLSVIMVIYFGVTLFTSVYSMVLNGTGKVKVQSQSFAHNCHFTLYPVVLLFLSGIFIGALTLLVYASALWAVIQVFVWRREINTVLKPEQKLPAEEIREPELIFYTK